MIQSAAIYLMDPSRHIPTVVTRVPIQVLSVILKANVNKNLHGPWSTEALASPSLNYANRLNIGVFSGKTSDAYS